jgi:hypothetical protein
MVGTWLTRPGAFETSFESPKDQCSIGFQPAFRACAAILVFPRMMSQISPGVPSGVIEHRLEAYAEKQAGTACLLVSKASRLTRLNRLEMSKLQSPGKPWAKLFWPLRATDWNVQIADHFGRTLWGTKQTPLTEKLPVNTKSEISCLGPTNEFYA